MPYKWPHKIKVLLRTLLAKELVLQDVVLRRLWLRVDQHWLLLRAELGDAQAGLLARQDQVLQYSHRVP